MRTPAAPRDDLRFSNTTGILQKKKTMWFIGVEVEQGTSAPPPKKNPRSAPVDSFLFWRRKTDLGAVYSRKSGCENHSRNYD